MKIKVVPYTETLKTERFWNFLTLPFSMNMLYPIQKEGSTEILFYGWKGKDMVSWYRFTDENKTILEFYPTHYTVIKSCEGINQYSLPTPKTLNDFINDMERFGVELYWTEWIDLNFEPKDYLHRDEIKQYYVNILAKINKSHELL